MPRRWSGLARVAVTGLAGGLLACVADLRSFAEVGFVMKGGQVYKGP